MHTVVRACKHALTVVRVVSYDRYFYLLYLLSLLYSPVTGELYYIGVYGTLSVLDARELTLLTLLTVQPRNRRAVLHRSVWHALSVGCEIEESVGVVGDG